MKKNNLVMTAASAAWANESQETKNKFRDMAAAVPKGTKAPTIYKRRKVVAASPPAAGSNPVTGSNLVAGSSAVEVAFASGTGAVVDASTVVQQRDVATTSTAVTLQSPIVPTYPTITF